MKLICIDDTNKPEDIPSSHWITKGNEYTLKCIHNSKMPITMPIFELVEIDLKPFPPYVGFNPNRFGIPIKEVEEIIERNEVLCL